MEQKAASVVDFMRMTCGMKAKESEKEIICKKFFGQGVQDFKKVSPVAIRDDDLRDYAIEIVFNAIEAFKTENIKSQVGHVWRPYVKKTTSSVTSSEESAKSETSAVSKKSFDKSPKPDTSMNSKKSSKNMSNTSSTKKPSKDSADSAVTPSEDERKLQNVFDTLSITVKPTKAGMAGLKVEELNRVGEALGGAKFLEKIEVVHGKRDKPVKADLVDSILKLSQ